jgi:hypothetical protein
VPGTPDNEFTHPCYPKMVHTGAWVKVLDALTAYGRSVAARLHGHHPRQPPGIAFGRAVPATAIIGVLVVKSPYGILARRIA